MFILTATLNVTGPLCAVNNTAPGSSTSGGFLYLSGASAIIPEQEDASIASTSAGDITIDTGGVLKCGSNDTSWAVRSYTIEGPMCKCNAAFQNSSGDNVCRSCALGFDYGKCACKVSGTARLVLVEMGDAWSVCTTTPPCSRARYAAAGPSHFGGLVDGCLAKMHLSSV